MVPGSQNPEKFQWRKKKRTQTVVNKQAGMDLQMQKLDYVLQHPPVGTAHTRPICTLEENTGF